MSISQQAAAAEKPSVAVRVKRKKTKSVIPGFGLSFGVTVSIMSLVVIIPLCSLIVYSSELTLAQFWDTVTRPRIIASYKVSLLTAFSASLINMVMGLILAWVLVRYNFPGKRIIDGLIEMPFALPTAVAGIALTHLTVRSGPIGALFSSFGIDIAYTQLGITVAMVFIGIPFVVRSVQPVLEKIEGEYEEAAFIMGASPFTAFRRVILPEILPALAVLPWLLQDVSVSTAVWYLSPAINRMKLKLHRLP